MLGRLRFSPVDLRGFRLQDVFDAIEGYNEDDNAKFRRTAELIRTATALLWNTQVKEECRATAEELWRFGWEATEAIGGTESPEEEEQRKLNQEKQNNYLKEKM